MSSTLQRRPGTSSGRVRGPSGWIPPEGSSALVLGCDEPGREGYFLPGDEVRATQADDFGVTRLVHSRARLRGPAVAPPAGWRWEAFCEVGGIETWTFELIPGETRELEDLAVNVSHFAGTQSLEFGLRVVGPPGAAAEILEVPAFYLDEIVLDELAEGIRIANRSPEPGAVNVQRNERVSFDLMAVEGNTLGLPQIYLDGVLVYEGGIPAPGYTVNFFIPYNGTRRFRIGAPYLFDSLRVVPVRVVCSTEDGVHHVDETWSFTVEDVTAPRLLSAVSRSHDVVRVTFDEPVEGAELPTAYDFERLEAPAVNVRAVSVREVSPTEYDVTLDIPITRGVLYRVTASDVRDVRGNVILAPYHQAEFHGYECPPVPGRRFELWRMIPAENRRQDVTRDLYKLLAVLQEVVDLLLCDVDRWTEILDVDVAAERYLDQMLIYLGNPFEFDLSADEKRRLIRTLVEMYQRKGTRVGIVSVVRFFLGLEIEVIAFTDEAWVLGVHELDEETILGPGTSRERFSFEVVSPVALEEEQREQLRAIIEYMKPAHTHLVRIREPEVPVVIDHVELGLSLLDGAEWVLH